MKCRKFSGTFKRFFVGLISYVFETMKFLMNRLLFKIAIAIEYARNEGICNKLAEKHMKILTILFLIPFVVCLENVILSHFNFDNAEHVKKHRK